MLKELGRYVENGCSLEVFWHYEEYDEDMKMIGEDISSISELNFQYVEDPSWQLIFKHFYFLYLGGKVGKLTQETCRLYNMIVYEMIIATPWLAHH